MTESLTANLPLVDRIGCAVLAGKGTLDCSGFASINGATSFRFRHVDELLMLHPGVVWVTSVMSPSFSSGGGARKPWLRSSQYFTTSLTSLIEEVGCDPLSHSDNARTISEIYSRCISRAKTGCGVDFLGQADSEFSSLFNDALGIDSVLNVESLSVEVPLRQASMISQNTINSALVNDIVVRLPLQRIYHMQNVLSTKIPSGAWHEINLAPKNDPFSWVCESSVPVLSLVSAVKTKSLSSGLMGSHIIRGRKAWVAQPELLELGKYSDIKVERVFCAEEYVSAASALARPLPIVSPIEHASISSGLFAESLLASVCRSSQGMVPASPMSVWMLAAAKANVLREASKLLTDGFKVISYGAFHVTVGVKKTELSRLRKFVADSENLILSARFSRKWKAP